MDHVEEIVPIDRVKPDPNQPRKTFDEESLKRLADSILSEGLINPVEVDQEYMIITGERRWRACRIAGLDSILVRRLNRPISSDDRLRRQIVENLLQKNGEENMPPIETARSYYSLLQKKGHTYKPGGGTAAIRELSKEIGVPYISIYRSLNLLFMDDAILEAIAKNEISATQADEIRMIRDEEARNKMTELVLLNNDVKSKEIRQIRSLVAMDKERGIIEIERKKSESNKKLSRILISANTFSQEVRSSQIGSGDLSPSDRKMVIFSINSTQEALDRLSEMVGFSE